MSTRKVERQLYLTQRTLGDLRAARRGRLGQRLLRRWAHRTLIQLARKGGLW